MFNDTIVIIMIKTMHFMQLTNFYFIVALFFSYSNV